MVKYIGEEINNHNDFLSNVIYKIIFPNGKFYVGQTTRKIKERKRQHLYDSKRKNNVVYKAIRKYGKENLKWEIIEQCDTQKELNSREEYWITQLKTFINYKNSNGYNETLGGDNNIRLSVLTYEELVEFGEDYKKGMKKEELWEKYKENKNLERCLFLDIYCGRKWGFITGIKFNPINSKFFTPEDIINIIKKFKECGCTQIIAKKYNVKTNCITNIIKGKTYSEFTKIENEDFYNKYIRYSNLISNEEILKIVELKKSGFKIKDIKEKFFPELKFGFISNICRGRLFSDLTGVEFIPFDIEKEKVFYSSRLTKEQVKEIVRKAKEERKNTMQISRELNIKEPAVYNILSGKTWGYYTGIKPDNNLILLKKKMTPDLVRELLEKYDSGKTKEELAEYYNISVSYIKQILSGDKWSKYTGIKPIHLEENKHKLTKEDVLKIVEMSKKGIERKKIANDFNISTRHISSILNGDRWNKITHIK